MCTEKHIITKNVYKWTKLIYESRNSIQVENRPSRPTIE